MEKFNDIKIDTVNAYRALRCILEGMIAAWGIPIKCTDCPFDTMCSDIVYTMKKFVMDD